MKCPIASQLLHCADNPACSNLSYRNFDALIRKIATSLKEIPSPVVSFIPKGSVEDIAFFFAAWRLGLCVYPLSFRLPEREIRHRVSLAGATLAVPYAAKSPLEVQTIDPDAIATYLETSSGSKVACHTLSAHLASAEAANHTLSLEQTDSYCLNLPLFHISGVATMIRTFTKGAHLLLKEEASDATHLSAVSTQLYRYLRDQTPFPLLKCLLVGGGPLPENLKGAPYPLVTTYGMTEAASMVSCNGIILPHIEAKIEDGQVWIKGPSLLSHYLGEAPQIGWFQTGNTGFFDGEKLHVTGRLDRVFISGGEKIQPETVERALLEIPGVIQAKVFPIDEIEFGQVPKAVIHAEREITLSEVDRYLREKLPRYMIPKMIENSALSESKLSKMS